MQEELLLASTLDQSVLKSHQLSCPMAIAIPALPVYYITVVTLPRNICCILDATAFITYGSVPLTYIKAKEINFGAILFAQKQGYEYFVHEPNVRKLVPWSEV